MRRKSLLILTSVILLMPVIVSAAGLVPCGGAGEPVCQGCYFVTLMDNIFDWLVGVLSVVFALIVIWAGMRMVTSAGNVSAKTEAKNMITNAIIGFVIVLGAWLIVDFVMKSLLSPESTSAGPWNSIECVVQPVAGINRIYQPVADASRGVATGPVTPVSDAEVAALVALTGNDIQVAAAAAAAGLNLDQTADLQALIRVESGSCTNMTSPVGAIGCMQIMPTTALQYDPSLQGLSTAEIEAKLMDNDYNIALGTAIYADLYNAYAGNEELIFAGYNGGAGANLPSADCPGLARWECVWDSPGCYGTTNTSCTPNTGYIETRNYVAKVSAVSDALSK